MRCHPLSVLPALSAVLSAVFATPLAPRWGGMRVKHAWERVPKNWGAMGHPPTETTIDLHLALKPHRDNALIDALYEVSDPKHSKYGAHLSKEEIADLVRPHPDTLQLVGSWLEHYNVFSSSISTTLGGGWLEVIGVPVSQANEILGASYQLYQHAVTNDTVIRTTSYSLPKALHGHIRTIVPTTYFGSSRPKRRMHPSAAVETRAMVGPEPVTALSSRKQYVAPSDLRWLYKTMGYVPAAVDQNVFGIAGYSGEYPSPQDLKLFMNELRTDGVDAKFTVVEINDGGNDPNNPGSEANLNIQLAEAMTYPTPHIYYSTGGSTEVGDDPYLHWLKYMLAQDKVPPTISTSYGNYEAESSQEYAWGLCDLFAILGARGSSVLFASGDWGVGEEEVCKIEGEDGEDDYILFQPIFPASCPWITSVGGTTGYKPEIAASLSGGGFSLHFPRPDYQDIVMPIFLQNFGDTTHKGLYNPGGRGYPDVSAQALDVLAVTKGTLKSMIGTSCSAPIVGGVISLLNDYLISKGQKPLGFLNLWLYGKGLAGFKDITIGSNPGCGTDGFPAIAGWDPVTGLGTPDFEKLEEIIDDHLRELRKGPTTSSTP